MGDTNGRSTSPQGNETSQLTPSPAQNPSGKNNKASLKQDSGPATNGIERTPSQKKAEGKMSKRERAMKGTRPSQQIYRPPRLRSGTSVPETGSEEELGPPPGEPASPPTLPPDNSTPPPKPSQAAGTKQSANQKHNNHHQQKQQQQQANGNQRNRNEKDLRAKTPVKQVNKQGGSNNSNTSKGPEQGTGSHRQTPSPGKPSSPHHSYNNSSSDEKGSRKLGSGNNSSSDERNKGSRNMGSSGNLNHNSSSDEKGKRNNQSQKSPGSNRSQKVGTPPNKANSPGPPGTGGGKRGQSPGPRRGQSPGPNKKGSTTPKMPSRQNSFVREPAKKKSISAKDVEEISKGFRTLAISSNSFLTQYTEGKFESGDLAGPTAQLLVHAAIEEGKGSKAVAKLCSLLMDSPSGDQFHQGLVAAAWQYFECREKLRVEHFRFWLAFLNFISDLYSTIGFTYEGELVEILFRVYDFMLKDSTLELLKIEELECLISSMVSVGYDLERQCPDQLSRLRDQIRDAFIRASEPWARKMILLLVELSASGWKLPPEANDYYFQTASTM